MHQWGSVPVEPEEWSLPGLKVKFLLSNMPRQGRVAEIGCGEGKLLRTLSCHYPDLELHGFDIRAPQVPPDIYTFHQLGDAEFPAESDSFEAAILYDVLEHVPDPHLTLREVRRILRPDGQFIAFIPVEGDALSVYSLWRSILGPNTYVETKGHVNAFSRSGLIDLLQQYFAIKTVRYAYHGLGHAMDATFFAALKLKSVSNFWWNENEFYHGSGASKGMFSRAMNALMRAANMVARTESSCLSRVPLLSAGVLVVGTPLPGARPN